MSPLIRGLAGAIGPAVAALAVLVGPAPTPSTAAVRAPVGAVRATGHPAPRVVAPGELPVALFMDGEDREDGSSWRGNGSGAHTRPTSPAPMAPGRVFTPPVAGRSALRRAGFLTRPTRAPPTRSD